MDVMNALGAERHTIRAVTPLEVGIEGVKIRGSQDSHPGPAKARKDVTLQEPLILMQRRW
jgi:hypothetical protein